MRAREGLSAEIVSAVAAEKGVEPTEITERLYPAVDGELLARLFDGEVDGRVRFEFADYEITVTSGGEVEATPL